MNEVKIDITTYNDLYTRAEFDLEKVKNELAETKGYYGNSLDEIKKLNQEIDALLIKCFNKDRSFYGEIDEYHIDKKNLAQYLDTYYKERAIKLLEAQKEREDKE